MPDDAAETETEAEPEREGGAGEGAPSASAPLIADEVLLRSVDLARTALLEITPAETIGEPAGHIAEGEHTLSLLFDCTLAGYPGWHWTVSLARVDDAAEPSVLETELMPGERALLAPEWVPWSERLAEYQAAQEAAHAESEAAGGEASAEDDGDEEVDEEDVDDDIEEVDESDLDDDDDVDIDLDIDGADVEGDLDDDDSDIDKRNDA